MERKNVVVEISPFLLVEATGDSEANSDPVVLTSSRAYYDGGGRGGDNEDAESCSSEWSPYESYDNHDVRDLDCGHTEECSSTGESDQRQWTNERGSSQRLEQQRWPEAEEPSVSEEINSFDDDDKEINKKPSGMVSSEVHLNEMEKSRLFWEACLAS